MTDIAKDYIDYLTRVVRNKEMSLSEANAELASKEVAISYGLTEEDLKAVDSYCKKADKERADQ